MLQLSLPQQLFTGQKLYHISGNVDKAVSHKPQNCRLVVVLTQPLTSLPDTLKQMVEKLVQACKLQTDEVVYTDNATALFSFQNVVSNYRPETMLFFGEIEVSRNLTALKKNEPYEFNCTKILLAQNLELIDKNAAEKKALWAGLQKMFGLK